MGGPSRPEPSRASVLQGRPPMDGPSRLEPPRSTAARVASSRIASSGSRHSRASSFGAEPSNTRPLGPRPLGPRPYEHMPPKPLSHPAGSSPAVIRANSGSGSSRYRSRDSVKHDSSASSRYRPSESPIMAPPRAVLAQNRALSRTSDAGHSNAVPLVAPSSTPWQLPAESRSPRHTEARSKWPSSQSEQTLRPASLSFHTPVRPTLMECYIDNTDGLKNAMGMLNEMAGEAARASDIAKMCNDNNVAGLERKTVGKISTRSPDLDQISLIQQIDKLKKEYGVKAAVEPEDSWEPWLQSEVQAPELELYSPFTQQEPKGPARGQSQTWQREHLRSSDPLQREMEKLFEEPSSAPSRR